MNILSIRLKIILAFMVLLIPISSVTSASNGDYLYGKYVSGGDFKILKSEWPIAFRCRQFGGVNNGQFVLSIRKYNIEAAESVPNAKIIFPGGSGYSADLYRKGLDWRLDWTGYSVKENFSLTIKPSGSGYYYDWSLADSKGQMSVHQTLICE